MDRKTVVEHFKNFCAKHKESLKGLTYSGCAEKFFRAFPEYPRFNLFEKK